MYSRVTNTADIFGHQSVDDFLHQRDDGIGKVYLRPGNRDGERGGDCRRRVAVATVETTDHGGFRFDESEKRIIALKATTAEGDGKITCKYSTSSRRRK